jgi:hypothetical protein
MRNRWTAGKDWYEGQMDSRETGVGNRLTGGTDR